MNVEKEPGRKSAKILAICSTIVYLMLFPILFFGAFLSFMVFDGPNVTAPIGLSLIFTYFWTPLSIPVTIYLMWSRYRRKQYKKTRLYCAVPLLTFVAFIITSSLIENIFLHTPYQQNSNYSPAYLTSTIDHFSYKIGGVQ